MRLDQTDRRIMRFLIKKPSASNSNLAECLGMPVSTVEKRVAKLCREQCIERVARISDWVAAGYSSALLDRPSSEPP